MRVRWRCSLGWRACVLGVIAACAGIVAAPTLTEGQVVRGVVREVGTDSPIFGARLLLRTADDDLPTDSNSQVPQCGTDNKLFKALMESEETELECPAGAV